MRTALLLALAAASVSVAEVPNHRLDLESAIKADPTDASSMLRLGILLQSEGELDAGGEWVSAAYAADPSLVQDIVFPEPMARGSVCPSATGPDVIVGDIPDTARWAHSGPPQNGISAFGIGTTSCNLGDTILRWQSSNINHPVIAQNIYRVHDGRFTQVGVGWLKHGFLALSGNVCCSCTGGGGSQLSPGCSDPYSSGLNASQSGLGPRFEVNATTGIFNYPFTSPPYTSGSIDRRCQAADADIDPARNPGARWFVEGHYIANDDAAAGNGLNNASYREVGFFQSGDGYSAGNIGSTVREQAAIKAWPVVNPSAVVVDVDVPDDGRFHVGSNVIDNGDGTWRYEYAIHNMNSDRSAQAFSVPVPAGVTISDVGFHDVDYHSGEPFDGTDWTFNQSGGFATWSTAPHSSAPNGNALRWGTAYSFWFTADAGPETGDASIRLFKPAPARGVASVGVGVSAPVSGCPADLDGMGSVGSSDLAELLAQWGGAGSADLDGSGTVGSGDLAIMLAAWGDCE